MSALNARHACLKAAILVALLCRGAPAAAQDGVKEQTGNPLDHLRPETIPEYERRVAAEQNGGALPEGLVAILGDSRWQHTNHVLDIAVTPDGSRCITAGGTSLVLWDLQSGEALRIMPHASGRRMLTLALSADGRSVAAGGINSDVTIWDLPEGRLRHRLKTMGGAVALSRDGRRLVTADAGLADISFWDAATGEFQREVTSVPAAFPELKELSISASRLAINPSGTIIAAAHASVPDRQAQVNRSTSQIVLWNAESGLPLRVLEGDLGRELRGVVFSDDGDYLAACGTNGHVRLWRVADGHPKWDCQPDPDPDAWAYDVQFSPGGNFAWTLTSTSLIPVDIRLGRAGTPVAVPRGTSCFDFLPDGERVVIGCGGPRILKLRTGEVEFPFKPTAHQGNLVATAFAPGGRQLVTAGEDGLIIVWDLSVARPLHRLAGHHAPVRALACSPDGSLLASGDDQGLLLFWETATGRQISSRPGPQWVQRIVFDKEGRLLAAAGGDGSADVWDLAEWTAVRTTDPQGRANTHVAFIPDSRALLTSTGIIDIDTGRLLEMFSRRELMVAASPDGARGLVGSQLRDLATSEPIAELKSTGYLATALFSPDGRRIAGINSEGRLLIWDANSGEALWSQQVVDAESFSTTLSFSHDGRYVAYPAGNGTVHIIRVPLPPPQPE